MIKNSLDINPLPNNSASAKDFISPKSLLQIDVPVIDSYKRCI